MKSYENYLQEQGYSDRTMATYLRVQEKFSLWCDLKDYEIVSIDYKACLQYIKELQQSSNNKPISQNTINHTVCILKIYFNYLIDEKHREDSPIQNINIRGVKRTLNHNLLEYDELEELFYSIPTRNLHHKSNIHTATRDKVITGLMVYQGLNTTSLRALKYEHIDLDRGKIYVPSTRKTNARKLEIKSPQILSLAQYVNQSREVLQETIDCYSEALIPLNSDRLGIITTGIFRKLKRINFKIKDIKQIRASVITYWLQNHNIREVQYMAGHRYISSTERYVQEDLNQLQDMIEALHPIN